MRAKDKLKHLDVRPTRSRGQSFLIDQTFIQAILDFGQPKSGENLLEIGPGLGALTERLLEKGSLKVVEIEEKFCHDLKKRWPALDVICEDARQVDLSRFGPELVVFGNLPYAFSTEIVFHLIDHVGALKRAVLMLQREFADRMAAKPGGRDYGVLSISTQLWAEVTLGPIVPGTAFHPPVNVQSRVLELKFSPRPRFEVGEMSWFKKVVKAAFSSRRRMLHNSLAGSGIATLEQAEAALAASGIDSTRRAETLSIEEFAKLAAALGAILQIMNSD